MGEYRVCSVYLLCVVSHHLGHNYWSQMLAVGDASSGLHRVPISVPSLSLSLCINHIISVNHGGHMLKFFFFNQVYLWNDILIHIQHAVKQLSLESSWPVWNRCDIYRPSTAQRKRAWNKHIHLHSRSVASTKQFLRYVDEYCRV